MSVKVTVPNTSSDSVVFGSANTPTAAEVVGIDSGSSNGQLAFKTTASGTSTERMRIDANGNVGIGSNSITQAFSGYTQVNVNGTNGATLQLQKSGTAWANFVADSNGLYIAGLSSYIAFGVGGSGTGTERMRIDSSGNVLIGTSSIISGSTSPLQTYSAVAGNQCWTAQNAATSGNRFFAYFGAGSPFSYVGSIYYNGTNTVFSTTSDQRLKENIVDAGSGLEKLSNVKIRAFDWKESGLHTDFGVVAQELSEVAPECVENGEDNDDGSIKRAMSVDTSILVPAMIKAIQELKAELDTVKSELSALKGTV